MNKVERVGALQAQNEKFPPRVETRVKPVQAVLAGK